MSVIFPGEFGDVIVQILELLSRVIVALLHCVCALTAWNCSWIEEAERLFQGAALEAAFFGSFVGSSHWEDKKNMKHLKFFQR